MSREMDELAHLENLRAAWRSAAKQLLDFRIELDAIRQATERGDIDGETHARGVAIFAAMPALRAEAQQLRDAIIAFRITPKPDRSFRGAERCRRDQARIAAKEAGLALDEYEIARAAAARLALPDRRRRPEACAEVTS